MKEKDFCRPTFYQDLFLMIKKILKGTIHTHTVSPSCVRLHLPPCLPLCINNDTVKKISYVLVYGGHQMHTKKYNTSFLNLVNRIAPINRPTPASLQHCGNLLLSGWGDIPFFDMPWTLIGKKIFFSRAKQLNKNKG